MQAGPQVHAQAQIHHGESCGQRTGAFFFEFLINGPEIMNKMADEPFEEAEKNSPAIIFIDEIDPIAPKREKTNSEVKRHVVLQLLTLMDELTSPASAQRHIAASIHTSACSSPKHSWTTDHTRIIPRPRPLPSEENRASCAMKGSRRRYLGSRFTTNTASSSPASSHPRVPLPPPRALSAKSEHIVNIGIFENMKLAEDVDSEQRFLTRLVSPWTTSGSLSALPTPLRSRETVVEVPTVKWDDVGGLEKVKQELQETVQYPVEHPEKFLNTGCCCQRVYCSTDLLVLGPELLTMWFGELEANLRDVFDKARAAAPCVMFFDELDSIAKARGGSSGDGGGAGDRVLNQILTEMDGMNAKKNVKKNVFIIGATNRPDQINSALLCPGRLDQLIYIPLPDEPSRLSILKACLKKSPVSQSVDLNFLAKSTHGFSGADLTEICQRAAKLAIRESIDADIRRTRGRRMKPPAKRRR
ncbi:P-loop containing nucleoside triphosphate hydrolase protein [Favolaschia claudopus]|uniref:P-loop containing nucleoside triphosphate hydrolase protein n=1 Tax=Favolaschia claudopus TaxID=2862362 RepID=A0AAW0BHP2_9AGAR